MKKFGLFLIGAAASIILLSQIGPILGLVISAVILYFAFKQYTKATSTSGKLGWGIAGVIMLIITASNLPAIIGLAAAYVLYLVYKKWNNKQTIITNKTADDPFANFEKQWSELNK
ncbi:flagellar basal body rod protein [Niallia circulans]|jgi:lia operon protein LiaI|uniref:lmo0954 family membrane protein n=1 Tax=Niallia TaxID=2837506 RepID=UPI000BA7C251|nr:flagellar basal body rod protein [Niallia circulans]PAD24103.1 flagellar basal body rod protein [Niallia circulans]PAD87562.1 flagellar basal body rod protein [Niallia circulans]PAE11276.1 flagellar basal body rod protein [Niallia circulans]